MVTASPRPSLFLVDVFAERPMAGNQLAVVVGARPEEWPTARMQAFAREMNFSETTFASPEPASGAFDVRIFTPAEELPFAGHPTLGTAWVLRRLLGPGAASDRIVLRLGVGEVPVEFEDGEFGELVRMRPRSPVIVGDVPAADVASALGIDASAIDSGHPCRRVSVGIEFVIVPLRDLAALRSLSPSALPRDAGGRPLFVYAFCNEACEPGGDLTARMFFEAMGVREDPATGSAAACLAAYLSAERWYGHEKLKARILQGHEIGRPSCLYVAAAPDGDGFAVEVAGKVHLVASGHVDL